MNTIHRMTAAPLRQTTIMAALMAVLVALSAAPGQDLHAQEPAGSVAGGAAEDAARRGPTDTVELRGFLDGVMAAHMAEKDIAGAVVAVVRDGEVLLAQGYGYADREDLRPVDGDETLFRIGSVSKLFTWTAVMQLVEQGRLDLDEDVNDYLDFTVPDTYDEPITLHHLLTHTPGFEDRGTGLFSSSDEPRGEWLEANLPARVRAPGTFSAYSNYGTTLAGYIVERVSGISWEEYIEEHILGPLGMENTTGRQPLPEHLEAQMSVGYANEGGRLTPEEFETLVHAAPAGSISSTGADMARFMIAQLQHGEYDGARILQEPTARWMQRRAFSHDERLNSFALGFYEKSANGVHVIGHGGNTQWFHTDMALVPEENLGVFVSYNTQAGATLSFGPFLELFLDHYYAEGDQRSVAAGDSVDLAPYLGTYRVTRGSYTTYEKAFGLLAPVRVSQHPETGELLVNAPGDEMRLIPSEVGLFRESGGSAQAAFRLGEDGRATHLFLGSAPMMAMERLAWYQNPRLHQILLGITAIIFLSALFLMPARYLLQRRFDEVRPLRGVERVARWTAAVVAVLALATLVGIATVLSDISTILYGDLGGLRLVLLLPVLAALLTLALLWFTVTAWRKGLWGRWGRVHFTAVTVSALAFVWVLNYWNLLGWRF